MKKILFTLMLISALTATLVSSAEVALKKFAVPPAKLTTAAGDKVNFVIDYQSGDGSTLYAYFVALQRRDSAKGFFENTSRVIRKHPGNFMYDHIFIAPYKVIKNAATSGQEKFTIDLHDFIPGKYKFVVNTKFMKAGKQETKVQIVEVTVTPKVDPVFNKLEVTPSMVEALPGDT
ncbi:MAG: hypothetical protein J6W00_06350, partial [Lentisphaeria bacterium]|nr:hypothetical protein [Lentisphaeria bacterium]